MLLKTPPAYKRSRVGGLLVAVVVLAALGAGGAVRQKADVTAGGGDVSAVTENVGGVETYQALCRRHFRAPER